MISQLVLAFVCATGIAALSYAGRLLTRGGAITQCVMGFILLGIGGWEWIVPTLAFFLTSSGLSKIAARRASSTLELAAKGSIRDAMQVLANGGVVSVSVLGFRIVPDPLWYVAGIGSLAAANADTWGTELGALAGGKTRLVTTFAAVEPGRSGGISFVGTTGGALGAFVIALSAFPWLQGSPWKGATVITCAGVVGSFVDSLLGVSVQAQYMCGQCAKVTERTVHCGAPATRVRGKAWIGNDIVNLACTISGAFCSMIFW